MSDLPAGTVTFLLTDIEGSTRLWEQFPDEMRIAIARHHAIVHGSVGDHGGALPKDQGEGDAIFAAFARARDAVACAVDIQRRLAGEPWPEPTPIVVRIGLHTGEAELRDDNYFGVSVSRCARVRSAGHGGQVLASQTTWDLVADDPPEGVTGRDLGLHSLKDLSRKERIFQVFGAGLRDDFPPLKTVESRPNNLPAQATAFVGRDAEVDEIRGRLSGDVRLLTVLGPGGIGKTRLAIEAAAGLAEVFEDGIWFVPLAAISDPALVQPAISKLLPEDPEAAGDLSSQLADAQVLLVLDNFEQVTAAADVVSRLLRDCPGVRVLATSREPLRVAGEHEFVVDALGVPRAGASAADVLASGAGALFAARAESSLRGFEVTADNATAVTELCRRLDGLPLAIELAAARVKVLPPQRLLERLAGRADILRSPSRDAPGRHQTLTAAIEWSYDLLDDAERTLFARLSVFAGGFGFDLAEEVAGDGEVDVLFGVESLVDKSLVRSEPLDDGDVRFTMLTTIREFARARLDASSEAHQVRARFAEALIALGSRAADELLGDDPAAALKVIEREETNLQSALDERLSSGHVDEVIRVCADSLFVLWAMRGRLDEAAVWLGRAVDLSAGSDPDIRALALRLGAELARRQGRHADARSMLEEALPLARAAGTTGEVRTLNLLGVVARDSRDEDGALEAWSRAAARARELSDNVGLADALANTGAVAIRRGEHAAATAALEDALVVYRELGAPRGTADTLLNLAQVAEDRGDLEAAVARHVESLEIRRGLGDHYGMVTSLVSLGVITRFRGRLSESLDYLREALESAQRLGDAASVRLCLVTLAESELRAGEQTAALTHASQASGAEDEVGAWMRAFAGSIRALASGEALDARVRLAHEAVADARAADEPGVLCCALRGLAVLLAEDGQAEDAAAAADEAVEAGRVSVPIYHAEALATRVEVLARTAAGDVERRATARQAAADALERLGAVERASALPS